MTVKKFIERKQSQESIVYHGITVLVNIVQTGKFELMLKYGER